MFGRVETLARRLAGAGLSCALASQAAALEYCVTCEGPPALYRCVVEGTPDGPGQDPSASLSCISQMATKGRHETCAVSRGAPFPCPGLTAVITQSAVNHAAPAPAAAALAPQASPVETHPTGQQQQAEQPAKPAGTPPRTVEELAGQTVKSSKEGLQAAGEAIGGTAKKAGEQIGNAGSAIGNAATKTWTCITSLFSSCSPAPDQPTPNNPAQEPAPESAPAQ